MIDFILHTSLGLTRLLLLVFIIVMPLMIALELFRHFGLLNRLITILQPITRRLGLGSDSVYPLVAGIIFGISYGGGVLISEAKRGRIVGGQAFLVSIFLAICHGLLEDTLIFVAQGAIWWIVIAVRIILATIVTATAALIIRRGWL